MLNCGGEGMSSLIKSACLEVAKINMWDNKPVDAKPISDFQEEIAAIGMEALEHYRDLGAKERDISDAIHYVALFYALPPIRNDSGWLREVLHTILDLAFPNIDLEANVEMDEEEEVVRFARKLIAGIAATAGIKVQVQRGGGKV